jgi:hypothetical protein
MLKFHFQIWQNNQLIVNQYEKSESKQTLKQTLNQIFPNCLILINQI